MPAQLSRANFPLNEDGAPYRPTFVQLVDAGGNLVVPDTGLTPDGATAIGGSSGDVANASATASLGAVAGKTNYLSGFEVMGTGATAGSVVLVTVTGLAAGTMTYPLAVATGAGVQNPVLSIQLCPPVPASAANTAITVTCPALGSGSLHNCVNVRGVRL